MKFMQIRHLLIALALAAAAPFAAAAFQAGMTVEQAEAEVKLQRAAGATLAQIIQNAQKAPLSAELITTVLLNAGFDAVDVVTAMLRAGAPLQSVTNAALAAGATGDQVTKGALAAGVPLNDVLAAIASSPAASIGSGPDGAPGSAGGSSGAGGSVSPS